jgi:hypothetical protein
LAGKPVENQTSNATIRTSKMIALLLPPYAPLIVAIGLIILLHWLRRPGKGGAVGRRVRFSDHLAWRDAVDEKSAELEKLLADERRFSHRGNARRLWLDELDATRREAEELAKLEPKL